MNTPATHACFTHSHMLSCPRAAQAALEEQVRTEAAEGELRLSDEQQAEFYRIQEEAGSRTAKLRADHAALQAAQARPRRRMLSKQLRCRSWHNVAVRERVVESV